MQEPTVLNIGDPEKFTRLIEQHAESTSPPHVLAYRVAGPRRDTDAKGQPVLVQLVSRELLLDGGVLAVNQASITRPIEYPSVDELRENDVEPDSDEAALVLRRCEREAGERLAGEVREHVGRLVESMEDIGVLCVPGGYSWPGLQQRQQGMQPGGAAGAGW